jgi:tetratricopeptide (TPR) repeat protein
MSRSDAELKPRIPRALAITLCLLAIIVSLSSGIYISSETFKKRQAEQMSTAELQRQAEEHASSPWIYYTLGVRLARTRDLPSAAQYLATAANLKPESYDIQFALGRCLAFMNAGDRAERALMDAIALKPEEGGPYVYLTMARRQQDHTELAIESAKKAVQLDPKNPEGWYQFGILYTAALGNEAEGAPHLKRAVELAPESGVYNFAYGTMLADLSQFVEAAPYLRKAVKLLPSNAYAHFMLAVCMHRNGATGAEADTAIA